MKRRDLLIAPIVVPAVFEGLSGQDKQGLRAPDVRYEPSTEIITLAMLKLARVTSKDVVYDLGCGDGRIVIRAVKEFGARGVGIDIDPDRISESRKNAAKAGVKSRIEFRAEDLFEADISKATVVMLYLWPWVNLKLRPKLLKELKPGTRVVSHSHDMGDWAPEKTIEIEGDEIHLWTIPKPENRKE
ncbi:MAG: class I SAM-dependent methyltransferase [Bryobacteraceae bacterium]|nr:class I SAM-dependent methyltransferase [Bryobacteraceae bacterium]